MARSIRISIPAAVLSAVALVSPGPAAQKQELIERGRYLYEIYCMSCHGPDGKGTNPADAPHRDRPADLTRIAKRNDGEFPFQRVYRTIDGREQVPEHLSTSMPIWGLSFQELDRDTDQEDEVRGKILQLIEYLKSIQKR